MFENAGLSNANKLRTRCPWEPLLKRIFGPNPGVLTTPQSCTPTSPPRPPCVFTKKSVLSWTLCEYANGKPSLIDATQCGLIGDWDVSGITDMSELFKDLAGFNEPRMFDNWDTSSVTDMSYMFARFLLFNQPLSFDTSKVTTMSR